MVYAKSSKAASRLSDQMKEGDFETFLTLIKQSGCLVTIIGGKLVFGEKNIRYKLICAAVVVAGIVVAVI